MFWFFKTYIQYFHFISVFLNCSLRYCFIIYLFLLKNNLANRTTPERRVASYAFSESGRTYFISISFPSTLLLSSFLFYSVFVLCNPISPPFLFSAHSHPFFPSLHLPFLRFYSHSTSPCSRYIIRFRLFSWVFTLLSVPSPLPLPWHHLYLLLVPNLSSNLTRNRDRIHIPESNLQPDPEA